jgi:hypothetical protein
MTGDSAVGTLDARYGPVTFLVAILHVFVIEFTTWLFMPYSVVLVLPAVLIYIAISAFIARAPGRIGQVGRGMLIGSLSGPLSLIIFGAVWAIAHAIGPI